MKSPLKIIKKEILKIDIALAGLSGYRELLKLDTDDNSFTMLIIGVNSILKQMGLPKLKGKKALISKHAFYKNEARAELTRIIDDAMNSLNKIIKSFSK